MKEQLPQWFVDTPAGKEYLAEAASAREVERRHLLEQLRTLDEEREKQAPALAKKVSEARSKLIAAKEAVKRAEVSHTLALSASHGAGVSHDHRRNLLLAQVRQLRPEVGAFVAELKTLLAETINTNVSVEPFTTDTMEPRKIAATNHRSHLSRVRAIQDAIRQAEAFYLSDDTEDLTARFEALRESIPDIEAPTMKPTPVDTTFVIQV